MQGKRESMTSVPPGSDPHSLLFGDDGDGYDTDGYGDSVGNDVGDNWTGEPVRPTRSERHGGDRTRRRRHRRHGRLFAVLALVLVVAVAYFVVPRVIDYFSVADYSGTGTGSVRVTVSSGDTTRDIADTLQKAGVVKSAQAFTDACGGSTCQSIQPGVYTLHRHMSGKAAAALITDPSSRSPLSDITVPEGATSLDVEARLEKIYGTSKKPEIEKALKDAANLGLPRNYTGRGNGIPSSAEGFLFPATYNAEAGTTPQAVLGEMVSRYISQDKSTGFADAAARDHLTPYDALIIASIAQSEAKFAEDMPKVARTIINRVKAHMPLQFDSTSSYACKLAGTPADKCIYDRVVSPYNTYTHKGLPPTPIDNPGAPAMAAAVKPAAGNYLYFVNIDAAGHLGFFSTAKAFDVAREKCAKNHWGCAD